MEYRIKIHVHVHFTFPFNMNKKNISKMKNLSVYCQSKLVPPGFRFHPTEEELLCYYLMKKTTHQKIDLDVLLDVDLNKLEPWDIQEMCKIGTTPQNEWYFFNHKDKKYPTGTRTNRATVAGFWKATGRDKVVYSGSKRIGLRKTLVFYHGRAPCGKKSDWIMYEYRFNHNSHNGCACKSAGESTLVDDGWVVCRIFKKKYRQEAVLSPIASGTPDLSCIQISNSSQSGQLDHLLFGMENETISNSNSNSEDILSYEQVQYRERELVSDPMSCKDTTSTWEMKKKDEYPIDISTSDGLLDEYFDLPCALTEILDENEPFNTNKSGSSMKKMILGTKHEQVEKMEELSCYNDKDLLQDDEQCWSNF